MSQTGALICGGSSCLLGGPPHNKTPPPFSPNAEVSPPRSFEASSVVVVNLCYPACTYAADELFFFFRVAGVGASAVDVPFPFPPSGSTSFFFLDRS